MTQIGRFSCIYGTWEIRKTPVMEARMIKEPPSNVETGPVHPEARKRLELALYRNQEQFQILWECAQC